MSAEVGLAFSAAQIAQLVAHLSQHLPEEACGLAAGKGGWVELLVPVENILHSPVKFQMSPLEQLKAFLLFEEQNLDLLAIYHSHPAGPPYPSATDLAEFAYPGVLVVIASRELGETRGPLDLSGIIEREGWQFRAFRLEPKACHEVKLGLIG